jgi:O-antigen/teichoic acid export membrane protein
MTESWQDRATTWPLGRFFLLLAVATGLISMPAFWWLEPRGDPLVRTAGSVLFALLFSALMTLWVYVLRRRETAAIGELPAAARIEIARALRLGEAPREPALDEKALGVIDRRRGQVRRSTKIGPWLWGLALLLNLVPIVLEPSVFHVAMLVYYAALCVVVTIALRRQKDRLNRAEQAIRARARKTE